MKKHYQCSLNGDREIIHVMIKTYFSAHGFQLASEEEDVFYFKSGNPFLSLFTLNPVKWDSEVIVKHNHSTLFVYASVNTFCKLNRNRIDQAWNAFFNDLQSTLSL